AGQDRVPPMRRAHLDELARLDLLASDHHRDLDRLARHARQRCLELCALRATWRIRVRRLVDGDGRVHDRGLHGARVYHRVHRWGPMLRSTAPLSLPRLLGLWFPCMTSIQSSPPDGIFDPATRMPRFGTYARGLPARVDLGPRGPLARIRHEK